MRRVKRLHLNHGAYHGETVRLRPILEACEGWARRAGLRVEHLPVEGGEDLLALTHAGHSAGAQSRIYLSAGIHGDEPAGVLAMEELLKDLRWSGDAALWFCPCLNPLGFGLNQRTDRLGNDLNRDYRHLKSAEVQAHVRWLERQPSFDVCLCLHEDWEAAGFYLYEVNPDGRPAYAESVIDAVRTVFPIDESDTIDGRPARGGIIRPNVVPALRPDWPEALYLIQHKTRLSYTLEAASDYPLSARVNALVCAVKTLVQRHCAASLKTTRR